MFQNLKQKVQQAWFDSVAHAKCVKLETAGGDESSDEEREDWAEERRPRREVEGGERDEEGSEEDYDSDEYSGDEDGDEEDEDATLIDLRSRVVGFGSFLRNNPKSDKFAVRRIHHVEFWCGDATNTANRFSWSLGLPLAAKSDLTTGNNSSTSFVVKTGDIALCFTAPLSTSAAEVSGAAPSKSPFPSFNATLANDFIAKHGCGVRAVAVEVSDVEEAYTVSIQNGAKGVAEPVEVTDSTNGNSFWVAEVALFDDVVLRYIKVQEGASGPFLPLFAQATNHVLQYGITGIDHIVGAVADLDQTFKYIKAFTGFHDLKEKTPEATPEKGKADPAANYEVLANNDETVLLPLVAPGSSSQSHTRTFLDHNGGSGIQHIGLVSNDLVQTVQEMKSRSQLGGIRFASRPSAKYYDELRERMGLKLSVEQLDRYEDLGILVDSDDRGILLQVFTKPIFDSELATTGLAFPGSDALASAKKKLRLIQRIRS